MQFEIRVDDCPPNLGAIEFAIAVLDPAVMIDLDAAGHTLRIATSVTEGELLACLRLAGVPAASQRLSRLPSQCCGGCGG